MNQLPKSQKIGSSGITVYSDQNCCRSSRGAYYEVFNQAFLRRYAQAALAHTAVLDNKRLSRTAPKIFGATKVFCTV